MNQQIAQKWTTTLRSGEYPQAQGKLETYRGEFCCLGVLCKLALDEGVEVKRTQQTLAIEYDHCGGSVPKSVMAWSGLRYELGKLGKCHDGGSLAALNDRGASFDEIADVIEAEWEKL